ncbi:MAG: ParB/RepB/Spo0J family partition protein [Dehalococcoidia bacterium]
MTNENSTPRSSRFGLGRGLGSLLPQTGGADEVDIDLIAPNPRQPRAQIQPAALDELAESVRTHGIIQPLVVSRRITDGGGVSYQLIAGERRLHAARAVGLTRVPVVVREATDQDLLELALIENIQRADLNPLEEADAYRQLIDEFGLTQEAVAERAGKSRTAVANTLRLQSLPEAIRASLAAGEISEGHARALLGLPDDDRRLHAWQEVIARDLTVRQTEELVRRLRGAAETDERPPHETTPKRPTDPLLADLEDRLQRSLGTQVRLERSRKGGRIVIRFYGDEDLEALLDRLLLDGA